MDKDGLSQDRHGRASRQSRKKQRVQSDTELSDSDEYVDFSSAGEINTVIVGEETETSSAVQSIQQVNPRKIQRIFNSRINSHFKGAIIRE